MEYRIWMDAAAEQEYHARLVRIAGQERMGTKVHRPAPKLVRQAAGLLSHRLIALGNVLRQVADDRGDWSRMESAQPDCGC